jgi:hypothetical protein
MADVDRSGASTAAPQSSPSPQPSTADLMTSLKADRLWLLRQLDGGAWPQWRLDLAALERELGELLDRLEERYGGG